MMASDHQMAVARSARSLPPAQISKSTRQVVPAFLQKLYEMVNDKNNSELIRWSEAGDSFFVLDHERFAHDVLGRWFKHRNFSSFVRQLNMYGFHKIPHLQQGVLKSDTETEYWNFAHANFHRGQPDLLCLIQRKKTANQSTIDEALEMRGDGQTPGGGAALGSGSSSQGQVIDVQAIVSGITAIKRRQTTISAELNELKRSNQLLWQDSMEARARYQKQQDTINRIVKFLAGVFGQGAHTKDDSVQSSPSHVVVPRRPARFMIEDANRTGKSIIEMDDMDTIETPAALSEPSPAPSDYPSVTDTTTFNTSDTKPLSDSEAQQQPPPPQQPQPEQHDVDVRTLTPTRLNSTSADNPGRGYLDALTPEQMQQLFASLSAHPLLDPNSNVPADPSTATTSDTTSSQSQPNANSHLMHYTPPAFTFPNTTQPSNSVFTSSLQLPTPSEGLISFNPYDAIAQPEAIERNWHQAEDIAKDVDALNTSIHQLIQTFGLDPTLVDGLPDGSDPTLPNSTTSSSNPSANGGDKSASTNTNGNSNTSGVTDIGIAADAAASAGTMPMDLNTPLPASDFDFDSFFNTLPETGGADGSVMDYTADAAATAFLDEPPSPAGTASPMDGLRRLSPDVSTNLSGLGGAGLGLGLNVGGGGGRKRKSDVSELDGVRAGLSPLQVVQTPLDFGDVGLSPTSGKAKRRKEN